MKDSVLKIYPALCEQQRKDLDTLLFAIDDFGAYALALPSQGHQGYSGFIEARDKLRSMIHDMSQHYRFVD